MNYREHELTKDCWCNPRVQAVLPKLESPFDWVACEDHEGVIDIFDGRGRPVLEVITAYHDLTLYGQAICAALNAALPKEAPHEH